MKLASLLILLPLIAAGTPEGTPADDLARVQAEPHADKRAHMALDNADDALKQAREAYDKGDNEAVAARLQEVERSVELAESSLKETGKNPSRSPKHFKYAELKTRDLLRKLNGFREAMSVADRAPLEQVIGTVQKVHDALLDAIMGKNK
jgi:hypothetical protein